MHLGTRGRGFQYFVRRVGSGGVGGCTGHVGSVCVCSLTLFWDEGWMERASCGRQVGSERRIG